MPSTITRTTRRASLGDEGPTTGATPASMGFGTFSEGMKRSAARPDTTARHTARNASVAASAIVTSTPGRASAGLRAIAWTTPKLWERRQRLANGRGQDGAQFLVRPM